MTESDDRWAQLPDVLRARRVAIDRRFKNLAEFGRSTGVKYKTLQRAEKGQPHPFEHGTYLQLDAAYQFEPGSIQRYLTGGDVTPLGVAESTSRAATDERSMDGEEVVDIETSPDGTRAKYVMEKTVHGRRFETRLVTDSAEPKERVLERMRRRVEKMARESEGAKRPVS